MLILPIVDMWSEHTGRLETGKLVEKKAPSPQVLIIKTQATMADPGFVDSCNEMYTSIFCPWSEGIIAMVNIADISVCDGDELTASPKEAQLLRP